MKGSRLLVLLAIADCANEDGRCWPSLSYLAERSRTTRRSAQRAIKALAGDGHIEIERNAGPSGVHIYRVKLDHPLDVVGRKDVTRDILSPVTPVSPGIPSPPLPCNPSTSSISKDVAQKELDGNDYAVRFLKVFGVAGR